MSTLPPHIIVGGLARCGTTLMMHMLYASGIPCIGTKPSFEVDEVNHRRIDAAFLDRHPGHALKLLDPHCTPLPERFRGVLIWLDRDPIQQANSQAKFIHLVAGVPMATRAQRREWASSLRRDRRAALAVFAGWPQLILRFEHLLTHPAGAAETLAHYLSPWWPQLDPRVLASQVRPRSTDCAPDLSIEIALSEEAEAAS